MAREKREKDVFSTYYIYQEGPNNELFKNKSEKELFLSIIEKVKEKYNFKLYAYCLNSDSYKLIIFDNGSDITKIMKSINVSLTMKLNKLRNSKGSIFAKRFTSKIINDGEELLSCSKSIHRNNEDIEFNSYCEYFESKHKNLVDSDIILNAIIGDNKVSKYRMYITEDLELKEIKCNYNFSKCGDKDICIKSLDKAKKKLSKYLIKEDIEIEAFFKNKKLRNKKIKEYRKISTLSLTELGKLFGGLSESSVCKIINREE